MGKFFIIAAALCGFLAVALGAFGAHALKDSLSPAALEVYRTAVQYQMFHTPALLIIGLLALKFRDSLTLRWCGILMLAGIVLFSGSLYALSITGVRWLGLVTPVGGVLMLVSWVMLAYSAKKFVDSVKPFAN